MHVCVFKYTQYVSKLILEAINNLATNLKMIESGRIYWDILFLFSEKNYLSGG